MLAGPINNAFWLDTGPMRGGVGRHFEVDVNEGHYPGEINLNYHEWEGGTDHPDATKLMVSQNLSSQFHVYGLQWDAHEIIWFLDGKEIRRRPITTGPGEVKVTLGTMVMRWAGAVSDSVDGKSMDIDWVRVYERAVQ